MFEIEISKELINRKRRFFTIDEEKISWYSEGRFSESKVDLLRNQITDFRFGVKWITGLEFSIGRTYELFLRDIHQNVMPIKLTVLYGYHLHPLTQEFDNIIQIVFENLFLPIINNAVDRFEKGESLYIGQAKINEDGISYAVNSFFKDSWQLIPWEYLKTHKHSTYFSIQDVRNPSDINRGFSYHSDWNTLVLENVIASLDEIMKAKIKNN